MFGVSPPDADLDTLSVLAGGWSAAQVDLAKIPRPIIAVNDAALHAPAWHFAVSMDRLWCENRWAELEGRANVHAPGWLYARTAALKNIPPRPWIRPFECDYTTCNFAAAEGWLNGTNSGACALNLAWKLRPRRLFLFGFDMGRSPAGQPYWYAPYPWARPEGGTGNGRYQQWAAQLTACARQLRGSGIDVLNVSASAQVRAFRRVEPAQSGFGR